MLSTDFSKTISKIEVPVYFISGRYDLTVNINLARNYFNNLDAPLKGFYTFENSAHSPLFEEPDRFRKILEKDILKTDISIADSNLTEQRNGL